MNMLNIESSLSACLDAAIEAHRGGYAHGMPGVIRGIEAALEALDDVVWGEEAESVFPDISFDGEQE